ncbi:hypothetical protein [Novosphingobium kaempferiae]|uniref:hypothetical protein n=1 Tax=Novosphingobium kaempferiae TaxID=2896849 RepID=UPI001E515AD8|nr:hypothetical protein [Novosphingobium kaempferiae]
MMARPPALPLIVRATVPERPEPLPAFTATTSPIAAGLPHVVPLGPGLSLGLVAPSGLARYWLTVPKEAVASDSASASEHPLPLRLLLRGNGGALAGIAPLVLGPVRFVGNAAPGLRLRITGWRIHAGSLVGAADFGSFVAFEWTHHGAATARFEAPTARHAVQRRLADGAYPEAAPVVADARLGPGSGRPRGYGRTFADA